MVSSDWKYASLFASLERGLVNAEPTDCPAIIGTLECLKATLMARMLSQQGRLDKEPEPNEPLLSIPEVAERLNIPKSRVYELARQGNGLPTMRIGKYLRISPPALEAWLARQPKKGLDIELCQWHNTARDRPGTPKAAQGARPHSNGTRRAARRPLEHGRAVGAGRTANLAASCSSGDVVEPANAEEG